MNKVLLIGRLTADPQVRYTQDNMAIARYTLAVDRRSKDNETDFISCIAFGKTAEFTEKYYHKGMKVAITGHIQTGSYTNKDGKKVYTTDVIVDESEFCESKSESNRESSPQVQADSQGFMNIPDGIETELPFA